MDDVKIMDAISTSKISDLYLKNTEDALNNNVWGAPTFVLDNELFWGQDRINFLERKIQSLLR